MTDDLIARARSTLRTGPANAHLISDLVKALEEARRCRGCGGSGHPRFPDVACEDCKGTGSDR